MALLYNPLERPVSTKALGNYMNFPSKKIKMVDQKLAAWIMEKRWYEGLITLPPEFEDFEYQNTKKGKEQLKELGEEGYARRIRHLNSIRRNLVISLKADMETSNMRGDARALASKGEIAALRELAELQTRHRDAELETIKAVEDLEKQLELGE